YLTAMLNLTMLLEMYGTLRSAADYHDWLRQTGFSDIKVIRSAGEKHMIVGKKNQWSISMHDYLRDTITVLDNQLIRTPLLPFHTLDSARRAAIFLKAENLQLFGSYKIRGIVSLIKQETTRDLRRGLSAASAGNMAQAVAYSAKLLQVP